MLLALAVVAVMPDLVPARWPSQDPASLDIVARTPVNCLLIEQSFWSRPFNEAAAKRGIATLALIRPQADPAPTMHRVLEFHFGGAVLEGGFDPARRSELRKLLAEAKLTVIELTPRSEIQLDGSQAIVGTSQGVWPGIQVEQDGSVKAAPSGAAWIDTNTGFLRFVRAATSATVWIANQPPEGRTYSAERYIQAIGDAAMTGAHWVISLDAQFMRKLLDGDRAASDGWARIGKVLAYYQEHKDWRQAQPYARLALVEDVDSGALLSGGILDMIATKHTPVRPVPKQRLDSTALGASTMAINIDPASLTPAQKDVLTAFTRAGGTLLTGPPGWKFPAVAKDQVTLGKDDVKQLDDIWKELNSLTGRKNLGARLFNVSSMLSNLLEIPGESEVLVQLINYSDFPVENVTVHVLGAYKSASLYTPEARPVPLSGYEVEDSTGYDVAQIRTVGTLVLKR